MAIAGVTSRLQAQNISVQDCLPTLNSFVSMANYMLIHRTLPNHLT